MKPLWFMRTGSLTAGELFLISMRWDEMVSKGDEKYADTASKKEVV